MSTAGQAKAKGKARFGLRLPLVGSAGAAPWEGTIGPEALVAAARRAEELGYAFAYASDHIVVPQEETRLLGARWFEPFVTLAYLGSATSRIRLLTSVVVVPYRSPLAMAKAIATVDFLCGGRFIFGTGVGNLTGEFNALGVPFHQRGAITTEYLLAMIELWTKQVASFEGAHCRFRDVVLSPKPVQKPYPPLWIGGDGRAAVRRAVEIGDGWMPRFLSPRELKTGLDYARTLPRFAAKAAHFQVVVSYWPLANPIQVPRPHSQTTGSLRRLPLDRLLDELARLFQAGATQLKVGFRSDSQQEYLEDMHWFAQEVMPRF